MVRDNSFITTSEMTVELIDSMGGDRDIVQAARVSVAGENVGEDGEGLSGKDAGLVRWLMKSRHGSPFEHNTLKFYVSAPIFVFREFMRHRIGFSYNEMSGRYVELPPKFYVPDADRALVNDGTSGRPKYVAGTSDQYDLVKEAHSAAFSVAVAEYNSMLDAGVAKEVARTVLPVGLYSEMYVTCNARSLMSFLALRVRSEDSRYETHPQAEIQMVAEQMEEEFAKLFPVTYAAFIENGRVAP